MRRLKLGTKCDWKPAILIPARNEAHQIAEAILPLVAQGGKVYVFDDESEDDTAEIASQSGATVIRANEKLPAGWTGKNRGCHELAKIVAKVSDSDWLLFLDADVKPGSNFLNDLGTAVITSKKQVVTGFPHLLPGKFPEPIFMAWVVWLIAATNPFGIVSRTGKGHNFFMNGQVGVWGKSLYEELLPHEFVKGEVLEDVKIGRMLGRHKIKIETLDLSSILGVKMYPDFASAALGMSKNSADIAGSTIGTILLSFLCILWGIGWCFGGSIWWVYLAAFMVSHGFVMRVARMPWWTCCTIPFSLLMATLTFWHSLFLKKQGLRVWKGRNY